MPNRTPSELAALIEASTPYAVQRAWEAFLRIHSPLLIKATRTLDGDYDSNMDRYAFVLEQLRADDFRRLRSFRPDARSKFTTWLVVVSKRLCIDHHRRRYGRQQTDKPDASLDSVNLARKRLADLIASDQVQSSSDESDRNPEDSLIAQERTELLATALSKLSRRDQLLLTLRFDDGATAKQIENLMGFPSQVHVYRRVNKVLGHLRRVLGDKGVEPDTG